MRPEFGRRMRLGRLTAAGPTEARLDDVAGAALQQCRRATSDRCSRGAEMALPLLCMDAGDRTLPHMVRV